MKILALIPVFLLSSCVVAHKRGGDVDGVIAAYRQKSAETEACYKTALTKDQNLSGTVVLAWKVDQTGLAKNARVLRSELASPELESCLLRQLAEMKFPSQPTFSPAYVEYELAFHRGREKASVSH